MIRRSFVSSCPKLVSFLVGLQAIVCFAVTPPSFLWVETHDTGNTDSAEGVAVDAQGNVYAVFRTLAGLYHDSRLAKFNSEGVFLWERNYDSGGDDWPSGVAIAADDGIITTGGQWDGAMWDVYVLHYDAAGNLVDQWVFDSSNSDFPNDVTVGLQGDIYLAGFSDSGTDADILILRYDALGNLMDEWHHDSGYREIASSIAVTDAGRVSVTGNRLVGSDYDFFTVTFDQNGTSLWERDRTFGSGATDFAHGIGVGPAGAVHVAGITYMPGQPSDLAVIKYDAAGAVIWEQTFDWGASERAAAIAVDETGSVFLFGGTSDGVTSDYLVVRLDADGNILWNTVFDFFDEDDAADMVLGNDGHLYVAGTARYGSDYDLQIGKLVQYFSISGFVFENGTGFPDVEVVLTGTPQGSVWTDNGGYFEFPDLPCGENFAVAPTNPGYAFQPDQIEFIPLACDHLDQNFEAILGTGETTVAEELTLSFRNPTRRECIVWCRLPKADSPEITIHDLGGHILATLSTGPLAEGTHRLAWQPTRPGFFLLSVRGSTYQSVEPLVILP